MSRLLRPTAEPLSRRRAFVDYLRRLEPRRVVTRLAVGITIVVAMDVGLSWRATVSDLGVTERVATVQRDVPAGSIIGNTDVAIVAWPRGLVPSGALDRSPVGAIARADLVAGEILVEQRLFPRPDGVGVGERIVTVPVPIAPPPLTTGTPVELFGILGFDDGFTSGSTRLAVGVVLSVDEQSIAVAVSESAVPVVLEHIAFGVVDVVIRP